MELEKDINNRIFRNEDSDYVSSYSIKLRDGIINVAKMSNNLPILVNFLSNLPNQICAYLEQTATNELNMSSLEWLKVPFLAVEQDRYDILQFCVLSGVNLTKLYWSTRNLNILMKALSRKEINSEIIELLISHIDINEGIGNTNALNVCIRNEVIDSQRKLELVTILLKAGANTSAIGKTKWSPLHTFLLKTTVAKETKWKEIIDTLLSHGQDIDEKDVFGETPLVITLGAMRSDWFDDKQEYTDVVDSMTQTRLDILEHLLEKGANPNVEHDDGCSCIHKAACVLNRKAVQLLLNYNCDANAVNKLGMTAIYYCLENIHSEANENDYVQFVFPIFDLFIAFGCDINAKGIDQSTVLHYAAAECNSYVCAFLCSRGANVDAEDYQRLTPLHMAARNDNDNTVEVLVKHGAYVNSKDVNNETPLHFACSESNLPVVISLIEHGARIDERAKLDITPLHLAAENGDTELIRYLLGGYPRTSDDVKDTYGATPLHYAASGGNQQTVEELLRSGVDKNKPDASGRTPLYLAQYRGRFRDTTLLADDDADIKFGRLPNKCFPNRPLIMEEEVDEYFNTLKEQLIEDNNHGQEFARQIIDSPGLGKVDLKSGDARIISEKVVDIVKKIARRIGELDDTFECTILRAGSTHEGVKTGYPDEFDFVCNVNKFSEHIDSLVFGETEGFTHIRLKETAPKALTEYCKRSSFIVNALCFQQRFSQLARLAAYDVCGKGIDNIYASTLLLDEHEDVFRSVFIPSGKLYGMALVFRGQEHKQLDISVDLNPVLFTSLIPQKEHTELAILPAITDMGIYLISKHCTQAKVDDFRTEVLLPESDLWRYSTHHLEAEVMHNLPQTGRDCYILCKAFRMEPLTCSINNKQSGMALLQDDIFNQIGQENYSNGQFEYGDITSEVSGGDDKESIAVCSKEVDTAHVSDNVEINETNDDVDYFIEDVSEAKKCGENIVNHAHGEAIEDSNEEDGETNEYFTDLDYFINTDHEATEDDGYFLMACNTDKVNGENVSNEAIGNDDKTEDDDDDSDGETTAEQLMPSYYLKSIFIKEAEDMLQRGEEWNESSLTKVPRIVYEKLLEAFDKENLTTLFMPSHNVLYRRQEERVEKNNVRKDRLRKMYCKHILSVMDAVGLDYEKWDVIYRRK